MAMSGDMPSIPAMDCPVALPAEAEDALDCGCAPRTTPIRPATSTTAAASTVSGGRLTACMIPHLDVAELCGPAVRGLRPASTLLLDPRPLVHPQLRHRGGRVELRRLHGQL